MSATTRTTLAGFSEILNRFCGKACACLLFLAQAPLRVLRNIEAGVDVIGTRVRLDRIMEGKPERLVDEMPAREIRPVDERDCSAARTGTTSTTDAVQERLVVLGAFIVDDVRDAFDIDTACSNIRRDKDVDLARAEGAQRLLARILSEIAVH